VAVTILAKVLALACAEPPGETTHWTGRAMAAAVGLSLRTIRRIWEAHRLQPHRLRTFKRSKDPAFTEKVEDIVGLYMHPRAHAVVLSIDAKSQIQALDRTQPVLPLKPGKCGTMTHDYKCHGTTTLFAFNALDGVVLGLCMQKHTLLESISPRPPAPGSTPSRISSRLRHGVFRSIVDLQAAINRYLNEHNCDPKPSSGPSPHTTSSLTKLTRLPLPSV
jgi:hypothetical protein